MGNFKTVVIGKQSTTPHFSKTRVSPRWYEQVRNVNGVRNGVSCFLFTTVFRLNFAWLPAYSSNLKPLLVNFILTIIICRFILIGRWNICAYLWRTVPPYEGLFISFILIKCKLHRKKLHQNKLVYM